MTAIKPEQIRWRVGSIAKDGKKAMLLGYIDSRTAMEMLDELDTEWSDAYTIVKVDGDEGIECALTVKGVTRTDVGVPSNTEGLKGAYSDALKRAAVKHGIGRELYELPRIWVNVDQFKRPTAEPTFNKGRWTLPSGHGSVFYDHEPTEQPEQRGPAKAAPTPNAAPVSPQYRRAELAALMKEHNLNLAVVEAMAVNAGVPESERPMSNASMDKLINHIIDVYETPDVVPSDPADGEAGAETPASPIESVQAGISPDQPAPELTMDDILEATGGEEIPPVPGSEAFKKLDSKGKLAARVWHQTHPAESAA